MADKPHRAIVLYGDGLLLDNASVHNPAREPFAGTTVEAANCPGLHDTARSGVSGFLALRETPPTASEGERIILELAQLLDVAHLYTQAEGRLADCSRGDRGGERKGGRGSAEDMTLPSLAERFMNLAAVLVTSSACAAALGERAGFTVGPLGEPTKVSERASISANGLQQAESEILSPPEPRLMAERLVKLLGLDKEEDRLAPPPSAAQRSEDEFELALIHVTVDDFLGAEKYQRGTEAGVEATMDRFVEPAIEASNEVVSRNADGVEEGGMRSQPVESRHNEETLGVMSKRGVQGSGPDIAPKDWETKWAAAVRGLEWLSSLVEELRVWARPDSKAASHMFLVLLLGYGSAGVGVGSAGPCVEGANERLPGVTALLPVAGNVPPELAALRPRQSYKLKEDKEVNDIRDHHPILAVYHLDAVTRRDDARCLGIEECRERGGNLAILADRFLHELTFKLWRTPKYGA